jgi:SNF2 family DNA or RNA helicase
VEQRLVRQLQARLGLAAGVRAEFSGEEAVAFAARLRGWEGPVRGTAHEAFRVVAPIEPRVRIDGEIFDVVFESPETAGAGRGGPGRADAGAVLRAWRQGSSLVPLLEGGWAPLPSGWLSRHGHLVADLLAARDVEGRVPRCALPDLARLCEELDIETPPDLSKLRKIAEDFDDVPESDLPQDLTATLRPYQREGVNRLVLLRRAGLGAVLADDMGLGKTVQALCALEGRTLVVCPTSVLHNWVDEIRRFRPGLRHSVYHGPGRGLDPAADVTLTTYSILRLDEEILAAVSWDTAILDEAQNVKNPRSQVTSSAWRLRARFRLALTGTPVENRLEELWSQFHFVNRGLLGGLQDFEDRYARPIADGEPGAAERLRRRIRPFVLRRLKRDVAPELPPRSEAVLYCDLEPEERAVYDAVYAATIPGVVRALTEGGSVIAALEALLRLRQAACHPALLPGRTAGTSSKVARLLDALDTVAADGHKALVFSQWTSLLDLVEPHLKAASLDFVRLDGSTRDRGGVVARFQGSDGPPVMLVSLKAGGTGLNLTAADHVFLMDPWWNPAVEDQASDRAHRIGQERPVMVYRLVAEETIEERILALQQAKRALADAALGDAERGGALTREDLLFLVQ